MRKAKSLNTYGYMEPKVLFPFRSGNGNIQVSVSSEEGNIISIENDGSLLAKVGLELDNQNLALVDANKGNTLATVELPMADEITDVNFEDESIKLNVKKTNGEDGEFKVDISDILNILDGEDAIDYNKDTKKISLKLNDSTSALTISEDGLGLDDDKIATQEELDKVSEKVQEISGNITNIIETIENIKHFSGVTEDILSKLSDLSDDVLELSGKTNDIIDDLNGIDMDIEAIHSQFNDLDEAFGDIVFDVEELDNRVDEISSKTETNTSDIVELYDKFENFKGSISNVVSGTSAATIQNNIDIRKLQNDINSVSGSVNVVSSATIENKSLINTVDSTLRNIISEQRTAIDGEISDINNNIDGINEDIYDLSNKIDTKASIAYVDDKKNETENWIRSNYVSNSYLNSLDYVRRPQLNAYITEARADDKYMSKDMSRQFLSIESGLTIVNEFDTINSSIDEIRRKNYVTHSEFLEDSQKQNQEIHNNGDRIAALSTSIVSGSTEEGINAFHFDEEQAKLSQMPFDHLYTMFHKLIQGLDENQLDGLLKRLLEGIQNEQP